jgi:glyoxylase-like metal-dependent hydrolase (beta-lactamase superfamily II)
MKESYIPLPPIDYPDGVTTIDVAYVRSGFAASHLIVENGYAAFIDTGTSLSVPLLLKVLAEKGVSREKVTHVMPTHVHLDHAGGAGALMQEFPNAVLVVHPRGARHMIDPAKLIAGTVAVYGEEITKKLYGTIVPVPEERVLIAEDESRLDFHGRSLLFLDAPGHARHHYCVIDESTNNLFSGDNFGIYYREFDNENGAFIFPTTTPVQFDPRAMRKTLDRLLSYNPQAVYLTHFGRVTNVEKLGSDLRNCLGQLVEMALDLKQKGKAQQDNLASGVQQILRDRLRKHNCQLSESRQDELLAFDYQLNAQGIKVWLDRLD